jgi:ABC-2 type transport system permease protein
MNNVLAIFKRELNGYFATPVAYVFIVIFLFLAGIFTFYIGGFYERNQADLISFFSFHPVLYLFLVPAISMRLWSEERKSGTIELILTLPISTADAVIGKFLAAWAFTAIALVLTFPMWITVNYLGNPDNTVVIASYIGSILMAGGFLAIGSCISAMTKSQVIAFVISVVICFLFYVSGSPMVLNFFTGWAPQSVINAVSGMSVLAHFDSIQKGIIDIRDIIYFAVLISFWLFANVITIDAKKTG